MKTLKKKWSLYNILLYVMMLLVIVVIIIMIIGVEFVSFFYRTVYSDFLSGNEQYLSAIVNRQEDDLQMIEDIVAQISLSDDVTRFRLEEQPEKSVKLMEHLKRYTTVSQFFDLLWYQYHGDEYIYNYSSSVRTEYFLERGCVLNGTTASELEEQLMISTEKLRIFPEQLHGGNLLNTYISCEEVTIFLQAIPPGYKDTLIFMVPDSYYDRILASDSADCRTNFLFYDGQIIVSRGTAEISAEELRNLLLRNIGDLKDDTTYVQLPIELEENEYLLSIQHASSGLYYGTLQSMDIFHDKVRTEQWGIMLLILMCIILACFVVIFVSRRIMSKVKGLNLLLNETSYYDLNSIENGIQTLVMTQKEYEKESLILKKTRLIRDFVRGDFVKREDAIAAAGEANLNIDYKEFCIVIIRNRELSNEKKVYSVMLGILAEETSVDGYGIHMINNNRNLFVLFGDSREVLEGILDKMMQIERQYCEEYVVAVSNYHTDFSESSKAYLEADTAFDNHLLLDNSKIIRFSDVAQKNYISLLPGNYLQRLRHAIRSSDKTEVELAVTDICKRIGGESASLYAFRSFYNDIIDILLSEWKGNREKLDAFYNVFTLSQCLNVQDFHALMCEVCNMIIDSQAGKKVKKSDIVQEAITYMKANYQDFNLTMNTLAEHLGVSSVTLSVAFKNEMDSRPSDYLSNLRIEKAKELLHSTTMLVKEISWAVGYEDINVFLRWFKKYTGMTPGQYRESCIENN